MLSQIFKARVEDVKFYTKEDNPYLVVARFENDNLQFIKISKVGSSNEGLVISDLATLMLLSKAIQLAISEIMDKP